MGYAPKDEPAGDTQRGLLERAVAAETLLAASAAEAADLAARNDVLHDKLAFAIGLAVRKGATLEELNEWGALDSRKPQVFTWGNRKFERGSRPAVDSSVQQPPDTEPRGDSQGDGDDDDEQGGGDIGGTIGRHDREATRVSAANYLHAATQCGGSGAGILKHWDESGYHYWSTAVGNASGPIGRAAASMAARVLGCRHWDTHQQNEIGGVPITGPAMTAEEHEAHAASETGAAGRWPKRIPPP